MTLTQLAAELNPDLDASRLAAEIVMYRTGDHRGPKHFNKHTDLRIYQLHPQWAKTQSHTVPMLKGLQKRYPDFADTVKGSIAALVAEEDS